MLLFYKSKTMIICFFKNLIRNKSSLKALFSIIGMWFFFANMAFGNNYINIFDRANDFYKKEQYDTSIILYESILKSGVESSEVYYNLGNAYYKKKNIARAILNFERAHKLAPGDDNISFNLQLAQTMIVDKINTLPEFFLKHWWRYFSELFSSNGWGILSIIFFIVALILAIIYLFTVKLWLKKLSFWLVLILIAISIVSFFNSYQLKSRSLAKTSAIVMTPSITIKSSPDENGTDLFVIHEGLKVWVIDKVDNWSKIIIADGNSGWLKNSDIEPI
jgi:tetratricopeptide (TPR) repeat protein